METSKKKVDEQKSVQSGIRCSADDSQKQLSRFRQLLQQNSLQLKDASLQIQTVLRVLENLWRFQPRKSELWLEYSYWCAGEESVRQHGAEISDGQRSTGGSQRSAGRAGARQAGAESRHQAAGDGTVAAARRMPANRVSRPSRIDRESSKDLLRFALICRQEKAGLGAKLTQMSTLQRDYDLLRETLVQVNPSSNAGRMDRTLSNDCNDPCNRNRRGYRRWSRRSGRRCASTRGPSWNWPILRPTSALCGRTQPSAAACPTCAPGIGNSVRSRGRRATRRPNGPSRVTWTICKARSSRTCSRDPQ